ncbi:MAG TPA: hypothetical protein PLM29_08830, partial [Deltaproteobacteria bacterium]|nr:hypothetical protein [Deltaproteobacteria bacterium]
MEGMPHRFSRKKVTQVDTDSYAGYNRFRQAGVLHFFALDMFHIHALGIHDIWDKKISDLN